MMQEMRMQWSVSKDSHWRRMELVHLRVCSGLNLCVPQKFHRLKSWLPWWWSFIGGAFGWWWSYGGDEGWSLLAEMTAFIYKRHTEFSSPSLTWGYGKKCVIRRGPHLTMQWKSISFVFKCFRSVIFCYSSPKGLRQRYNNLYTVQ